MSKQANQASKYLNRIHALSNKEFRDAFSQLTKDQFYV